MCGFTMRGRTKNKDIQDGHGAIAALRAHNLRWEVLDLKQEVVEDMIRIESQQVVVRPYRYIEVHCPVLLLPQIRPKGIVDGQQVISSSHRTTLAVSCSSIFGVIYGFMQFDHNIILLQHCFATVYCFVSIYCLLYFYYVFPSLFLSWTEGHRK